jgi:tRNA dimethylallyltransferase
MLTIGYREFREYEAGTASIQEVRRAIIMHTLQYAKRQRTWFRRNNSIHWIRESEEAVALVTTFLNK